MPGIITTGPANITPEQAGLGDVQLLWPDLRIAARGPNIQLAGDKSKAVVPFKIGWDRRFELVARLLGWPYWDGENIFKRNIPESYRSWEYAIIKQGIDNPLHPIPVPVMYCTQILDIKGIGDGAQDPDLAAEGFDYYPEPTYQWAEVTAQFETLMYDVALLSQLVDTDNKPVERQRYVIKTEESGGKYLQFQWGQWKLIYDDGVTVHKTERLARQVNFIEPFKTIRYEWLDVLPQALNMPRADGMLGSTNDDIFDDYPAQTLLLQKFDRKPTMTQLGVRTYRVLIEVLYLPSGVNRAKPPSPQQQAIANNPGPSNGYWDIVDYETEAVRPYAAMKFANLFRP